MLQAYPVSCYLVRFRSIRSTATERSVGVEDEKIYGTVCANMDEINQEIKKVVDSIGQNERVCYCRCHTSWIKLIPKTCIFFTAIRDSTARVRLNYDNHCSANNLQMSVMEALGHRDRNVGFV